MNKILETPFIQIQDSVFYRQIVSFSSLLLLLVIALLQKPSHAAVLVSACLLAGALSSALAFCIFKLPLSKSLFENSIYSLTLFLFLPIQLPFFTAFFAVLFGVFVSKQIFGISGMPFSPILTGLALLSFSTSSEGWFSTHRFLFIELIPAPFIWASGFLLIWKHSISVLVPFVYLCVMLILHLLSGVSAAAFLWNPFIWGTAFFVLGDTRLFLSKHFGGVFLGVLAALLVWYLNNQLQSPMGFIWPFILASILTFPMRKWKLV